MGVAVAPGGDVTGGSVAPGAAVTAIPVAPGARVTKGVGGTAMMKVGVAVG